MPKKSCRSRCVHRPYSFAHLHPPLLHKRASTCTKKNCKSWCLRACAPFTTLSDECAGMHTLLAATSTHTRPFRCCTSEHTRPSPYAPLPTWCCFAHPHQPHHLLLHERASTHTHADHCPCAYAYSLARPQSPIQPSHERVHHALLAPPWCTPVPPMPFRPHPPHLTSWI